MAAHGGGIGKGHGWYAGHQHFLKIAEVVHTTYIYVPVIGLADGIIDWLYAKNMDAQDE